VEERYLRRVTRLPEPTQRLILLAAAEPLGDAALLWRAADRLSSSRVRWLPRLMPDCWRSTTVFDFATRWCARRCIEPRHQPNDVASTTRWRSRAIPSSAPTTARGTVGSRLPSRTNPMAADLERCAVRAQDRGGLAAAAAFLERATALTPIPIRQAARASRREASFQAGEFEATQRLLAMAQGGALDGLQQARATLLRGHVAVVSRYGNEGATLLREAAQQLEPFDLSLARRAYLTAWNAAITAHHLGGADILLEVSRAIRALPPLPPDPHPLDLVIEAFAVLITDGHTAAMPILRRAADDVMHLAVEDVVRWGLACRRRANSDVARRSDRGV
jgi:hypothetical protein